MLLCLPSCRKLCKTSIIFRKWKHIAVHWWTSVSGWLQTSWSYVLFSLITSLISAPGWVCILYSLHSFSSTILCGVHCILQFHSLANLIPYQHWSVVDHAGKFSWSGTKGWWSISMLSLHCSATLWRMNFLMRIASLVAALVGGIFWTHSLTCFSVESGFSL